MHTYNSVRFIIASKKRIAIRNYAKLANEPIAINLNNLYAFSFEIKLC